MRHNTRNRDERTERKLRSRSLLLAATCILLSSIIIPAAAMAGKGGYRDRERRLHVQQVQTERFVIDYGDSFYRGHKGEGSTLFLKKALKHQYPGIDVSNYRLKKVVLVAKSRFGNGSAQLRVGPELSDYYGVAGRPQDFNSGQKHTFDRVRIHSPFSDSWGPWQLNLYGIFKVRKVVLEVEKRQPHHYGRWNPPHIPEPQYREYHHRDGRVRFNIWW